MKKLVAFFLILAKAYALFGLTCCDKTHIEMDCCDVDFIALSNLVASTSDKIENSIYKKKDLILKYNKEFLKVDLENRKQGLLYLYYVESQIKKKKLELKKLYLETYLKLKNVNAKIKALSTKAKILHIRFGGTYDEKAFIKRARIHIYK